VVAVDNPPILLVVIPFTTPVKAILITLSEKVIVPEDWGFNTTDDWAPVVFDTRAKASTAKTKVSLRIMFTLNSSYLSDPRARKTFGSVLVGGWLGVYLSKLQQLR
jgi:hypothetical protein